MISITTQKKVQYLDINGRKVRSTKGNFVLKRDELLQENLYGLPTGMALIIDNGDLAIQPEHPVLVLGFEVLSPNELDVVVDHHQFGDRWFHFLSFVKYMSVAGTLLESSSASSILRPLKVLSDVHSAHQLYRLNLSAGTFSDIESQAIDTVTHFLQPLLDLRDEVDRLAKIRLGI